jgi:ribosome-associated translation inhibitor RaiA
MKISFWHEQSGQAARLSAEVENVLRTTLSHVALRIQEVAVRARDINGTRGGNDQQCRVTARLKSGDLITLSERHRNLFSALGLAADRLAEAIVRTLRRRKKLRRQSTMAGQQPARPSRKVRPLRGLELS